MRKLIDQLKSLGFAETDLANHLVTSRETGFAYTDLGACNILVTVLEFGPGDVRETHTHPEVRVTFVRSGKMVFVSDGQAMELETGDVVFTLPQVPHSLEVIGDEPLRVMEVVIQPLLATGQH